MAKLSNLNNLFYGAYSLRFRPILNSLHMDIPELDNENFSHVNTILKTASIKDQLILTLSFKMETHLSLTIQSKTESFTIEKLRPMYNLKEKLLKSNAETVELCLFNYRHSGMYMGTNFKLKLEE